MSRIENDLCIYVVPISNASGIPIIDYVNENGMDIWATIKRLSVQKKREADRLIILIVLDSLEKKEVGIFIHGSI